MALSDEQNAMLRLLAQGEQGYGDIAALMGLEEDEVRAKVVGALAQLEAEGKPAPDIPPPIQGGARPAAEVDPPEPEEVVPVPAGEAEEDDPIVAEAVAPEKPIEPLEAGSDERAKPAERPKAAKEPKPTKKPKAPKPGGAAGPRPTPPPAAAAPGATPPSDRPTGGRTITLPSGRRAWLLGGGVVVAIAAIVVVILLLSGGGDDNSSSVPLEAQTAGANQEAGRSEAGTGTKELTQAQLTAVDGSEAAGVATFGRLQDKLALQIEATGLEPTKEGTNSYTIWLAQSPTRMLPLASTGVKAGGKTAGTIAAQFEVPVEVLAYLANATFDQIAITRTNDEKFKASITEATKAKTTPSYTGQAVLRGTIVGPIIGLARREEEERKGE